MLRSWIALSALFLLAATWRLWWGQSEFPAIPFSQHLCDVPLAVDRWLCVGLVLSLVTSIFASPRMAKFAWAVVMLMICGLVALNQHRLQPWVLQLIVYAAILVLCSERRARILLTAFVGSVYIYSALGKFDAQFLHTVGQQFWGGMLEMIGQPNEPERHTSIGLIASLPLSELLIGLGLLFPRTRRVTGVAACLFHLMLIMLLGPLGLNHSPGVVMWNLQFAGQALLLFVVPKSVELPKMQAEEKSQLGNLAGTVVAILVILLPLSERVGYWDHWASWALYAPHSSRTEVWVAHAAVQELPASLRREFAAVDPHEDPEPLWVRVPIERWSLAETGTPIYPQARFQLGVARALAKRLPSDFMIRVVLRSTARRWDGRRESQEAVGSTEIERAASKFLINTRPRSNGPPNSGESD